MHIVHEWGQMLMLRDKLVAVLRVAPVSGLDQSDDLSLLTWVYFPSFKSCGYVLNVYVVVLIRLTFLGNL